MTLGEVGVAKREDLKVSPARQLGTNRYFCNPMAPKASLYTLIGSDLRVHSTPQTLDGHTLMRLCLQGHCM